MLITAKPVLESKINQILFDSLYKSLNLMYSNSSLSENVINSTGQKEIDDASEKTAKSFADNASGPLADAIYDFVKSIGITATPKGTLISPGGMAPAPVTGSIIMSDFTIS